MRIAVTGGSGKLGKVVVQYLRDEGNDVVNLDRVGERGPGFLQVDFTDYGQVVDALQGFDRQPGFDAVVHLAAIPAGGILGDAATFHNNMASTFNVFWGATRAGIQKVVYASSETLLGIPFEIAPPYLPIDEEIETRPESTYSIVKHLEEELAQKLIRWDSSLSITALRFSNVMVPSDYARFADFTPDNRKWNLWGYIDARDASQAISLALDKAPAGFDTFIIANADTVLDVPSAQLAADFWPSVPLNRALEGTETLLSIDKARRVLGYEPKFGWRSA
jgi:nucleoside-diphosphate-sugar epimerase